jgi:hypothetical protein
MKNKIKRPLVDQFYIELIHSLKDDNVEDLKLRLNKINPDLESLSYEPFYVSISLKAENVFCYLFEHIDVKEEDAEYFLIESSKMGLLNFVKFLIKKEIKPDAISNSAIIEAYANDQYDVANFLFKYESVREKLKIQDDFEYIKIYEELITIYLKNNIQGF